jgi:hypothetical protein
MRGFQTGPALPRKGCLLLLIFLLPFILHGLSLMFPAAEIFQHYDELDKERQLEMEELQTPKQSKKTPR